MRPAPFSVRAHGLSGIAFRAGLACSAALPLACPSLAHAQETILIAPPDLPDYDRGRNLSVTERPRPDYDAIGLRRGAFLLYPRLQVGAGASDNVYLTSANKVGDVYAIVRPSLDIRSDWSSHQLSLGAGGAFRRYFDETRRNQDEWNLNGLGRVDMGSNFSLTAEGQIARAQESPFTGAIDSQLAALSSYDRITAALRGQYLMGRSRLTLSYDFNNLDFSDIEVSGGTKLSQADRDRDIYRVTAQAERAISPSLSLYSQFSYTDINYDRPLLSGAANRSSTGYRVIGGVHFDLSAFLRGSVGVGYIRRNYNAALYKDVGGVSVETKVEYFPSTLTMLTLNARRVLDDSSIGGAGAFFDNQLGLRVDHELLSNLLINLSTLYDRQDYVGSPQKSDIYQVAGGVRYLLSRSFELSGNLGYSHRMQADAAGLGNVTELSGELGLTLKM